MDGSGGVSAQDLNYRYLNRDGQWLDFSLHGIERRADGSLTLAVVPAFSGPLADLPDLADGAHPAGIAVEDCGAVYFTLPDQNVLARIDPCDGTITTARCLQLNVPRGLAYDRGRQALLVCDSGNGRVLIVNAATWEELESRRGFESPVAIAVDEAGNSYVADAVTKQVRKFTAAGYEDGPFNSALRDSGLIQDPAAVAVFGSQLYVLDNGLLDVLVFSASGQPVKGKDVLWKDLVRPSGIAVTADSIYVGDNQRRRVLRYLNGNGFRFAGEAVGYEGPVAALAIGPAGDLLVHTGQLSGPARLTASAGFARTGILSGGPFAAGPLKVVWHSLYADMDPLPSGTQARLFVFAGKDAPAVDASAANPFPAPWSEAPLDATDVYIGGDPALNLWVGALLSGDGGASPVIRELKARFNQQTYLPYLPAVYRNSARSDFLARFLALCESFNVNTEDAIARLPELFDTAAVPPQYLPWLAEWLALDLDQRWDTAKQRAAIAGAYQRYARRGTVEGLREIVAFETGVQVSLEEPIQDAGWWVLPGPPDPCGPIPDPDDGDRDAGSQLGFSTVLSQSNAQGAVIGSTAILDRSRIIAPEDVGLPLFDEVAHRFTVILPSQAGPDAAAAVARVVDREKPAHTTYHICSFQPRMSVGFQARIGIDTIVGGQSAQVRLDSDSAKDGIRLGGKEQPRIGMDRRIGDGLRL
jgi:phage tail-like protein